MATEFEAMVEKETNVYEDMLKELAEEVIQETLADVLGDDSMKFSGVTVQHVRRGVEIAARKSFGLIPLNEGSNDAKA